MVVTRMGAVRNSWILNISNGKPTECAEELDVRCEKRRGL